jgi:hypothetical protein
MITKKDIRDWMIDNNVYGGNIDQIDERLRFCQRENYWVRTTSADFDKNGYTLEDKFDGHFADIERKRYSEIPDGEPCISYLDILDKL